jgi:hypothetical protein
MAPSFAGVSAQGLERLGARWERSGAVTVSTPAGNLPIMAWDLPNTERMVESVIWSRGCWAGSNEILLRL